MTARRRSTGITLRTGGARFRSLLPRPRYAGRIEHRRPDRGPGRPSVGNRDARAAARARALRRRGRPAHRRRAAAPAPPRRLRAGASVAPARGAPARRRARVRRRRGAQPRVRGGALGAAALRGDAHRRHGPAERPASPPGHPRPPPRRPRRARGHRATSACRSRRRRARCWTWPPRSRGGRSSARSTRRRCSACSTPPSCAPSPPRTTAARDAAPHRAAGGARGGHDAHPLRARGGVPPPLRPRRRPAPRGQRPRARLRVGLRLGDRALVVEVDGFAFHRTRRAFERDRARDAVLAAAGVRTLRFTARQVEQRPVEVVAALRAAQGRSISSTR